jgi:TM2 domain-containing membrane protein YozV
MKKLVTSKLGLFLVMLLILFSSCSTNATFTKRYHSRGFNIAWGGGGSNANNNVVKQTSKKVKAKSDMVKVAQNTESLALQSVNSAENAIVNPANQNPELFSNSLMNQNGKASANNYFKSTSEVVKSSNPETKTVKAKVVSKPNRKAKQKDYDPREGKSHKRALLLCLILGLLGIHRFYLGYKKIGMIQLALTVVYFLFNVGDWILYIGLVWAIVDFIRIYNGTLEPKDGYYLDSLEDI